ncbi:hypothetical protein EJ03DRAFT_48615 [Teratosphaeria nubilosa]|uniref:Uncharacterized protein n=1 Tax=Teratosphaeria nubilosa TaxID=161662 RepID=A0A6G1KU29_9PEZI|nr:hypothetical protein EJ03DRAFT_48615 [Teratosphaeria nubilosa]
MLACLQAGFLEVLCWSSLHIEEKYMYFLVLVWPWSPDIQYSCYSQISDPRSCQMSRAGYNSSRPSGTPLFLDQHRKSTLPPEQANKQLLDQIDRTIGFLDHVEQARCQVKRITAHLALAAQDLNGDEGEDQIARLASGRRAARRDLAEWRALLYASHTTLEALIDSLGISRDSSALLDVMARMRYASSLVRRSRGSQTRRAQLRSDLQLLNLALSIDIRSRRNSWGFGITTRLRRRMLKVRDAIASILEAPWDRSAEQKAEAVLERFYLRDAHRLVEHLDRSQASPQLLAGPWQHTTRLRQSYPISVRSQMLQE